MTEGWEGELGLNMTVGGEPGQNMMVGGEPGLDRVVIIHEIVYNLSKLQHFVR